MQPQQLILLINTFNQRAATNQLNQMLWLLFKQMYPQPSPSHDCPSILLETATLKHATMQSCGCVCICQWVQTSIHSFSVSTNCHQQLLLSSTKLYTSCSVNTDKVSAGLLSKRLKCIYKFCHAVISVTLLLLAEVKSCYNANPEQRFSVPLFCWRSVHISCADKTTLGPCEAVWRVGRDPEQPIFQPSKAELSCRVPAVSGSTK